MSKFISFLNAVTSFLALSHNNTSYQAKEACLYKFQQFLECILQSLGSNGDSKNTDTYFRVSKIVFFFFFSNKELKYSTDK